MAELAPMKPPRRRGTTLEVIIAIAGTIRPPLLSIVADMASNTRARGMGGKLVTVKRSAALAGTTNRYTRSLPKRSAIRPMVGIPTSVTIPPAT